MFARAELPSTLDHPSPCIIYEFAHPLHGTIIYELWYPLLCPLSMSLQNLLLLMTGYHETFYSRFDFRDICFYIRNISSGCFVAVGVFGGVQFMMYGVGYGHARQVFPDSVSSILAWPFNHSCWDVSLHQCVLTQRPSCKEVEKTQFCYNHLYYDHLTVVPREGQIASEPWPSARRRLASPASTARATARPCARS